MAFGSPTWEAWHMDEYILAYVADAENYSYGDALALAAERDVEAAARLEADCLEVLYG